MFIHDHFPLNSRSAMLLLFLPFPALSTVNFTWPPSYTIRGTWRVPYTNLSNPILISHEPTRQYQSQLNGLERIWTTTASEHFHRKIVTNGSVPTCFGYSKSAANWDLDLTMFLPDLAEYETREGLFSYRGRIARLHERTLPGGKTQYWQLYTDPETNFPLAYVAHAISVFGSHYDDYILDIDSFVPSALPGAWVIPGICSGADLTDDPYPGHRLNLYFPGKRDHSKENLKKLRAKGVNRPVKFLHMEPKDWLKTIVGAGRNRRRYGEAIDKCGNWDDSSVTVDLPNEFSWRDTPGVVGAVRDQVACGSCWAFATAEAIESQFAVQTGVNLPISTSQVMDCTWVNGNDGCAGGDAKYGLSWFISNGTKVAYEADYPYLGVDGACKTLREQDRSAGTVDKCWHIARTTTAVKKALYTFGPLAIAIDVTEGMLLYTGGAFNDTQCIGAEDSLDHAVQLTGWRFKDGVEAWEIKNSWSTNWGDDGYLYIQAVNQEWGCGVTTDAIAVEVRHT
jgi:hypothetical protein